jgi:histidine triad (HIT) family protein
MLSPEQVGQIKSQILKQIENFPPENRESARQQIESMNSEQLEEFLEKNKLIKTPKSPDGQQCIFCSINSGDIDSYKIDENKIAIAILEINPISKGHTLIIPKKHSSLKDKIPAKLSSFSKKISKKIKAKLKPKEVKIYPVNLFGHGVINLLPVYTDEDINSERQHATADELREIQKIFLRKEKIAKPKVKKVKFKENTRVWLPKRIP